MHRGSVQESYTHPPGFIVWEDEDIKDPAPYGPGGTKRRVLVSLVHTKLRYLPTGRTLMVASQLFVESTPAERAAASIHREPTKIGSMPFAVAVIERCEPNATIRSGWVHVSGTASQPEFPHVPNFVPSSFVLVDGCSPSSSRVPPLDTWLTAAGPVMRRGPLEHPPGWCIWENNQDLPDAVSLRRVYFRFVHTRLRKEGKRQVVATQIFVPSNPDAPPPSE